MKKATKPKEVATPPGAQHFYMGDGETVPGLEPPKQDVFHQPKIISILIASVVITNAILTILSIVIICIAIITIIVAVISPSPSANQQLTVN